MAITAKDGWITLGIAVAAGFVVYLLEVYLPVSPRSSKSLPTTVNNAGTAAVPTGSLLAGAALSDQADVDSGQGVQPQVQTEAAYNVGSTGTADSITTGISGEDDDYAQYDDSNAVLSS